MGGNSMIQIKPCQHEDKPADKVSGELTIYAAAEARRELQRLHASWPDLLLDLSEIEEIDSAGVQLLWWLKRNVEQSGHALALVDPSPAVVEVLDLLKLTGTFGLPSAN